MTSLEERVARAMCRARCLRERVLDSEDDINAYLDKFSWLVEDEARAAIAVCAEEMAATVDKWADANGQMTEFDDEGRIRENAAEEIAAAIRSMGEKE